MSEQEGQENKDLEGVEAKGEDALDYFICDILQSAPKNDLASMEHPIFTLSTKKDTRIRRYEHNKNYIEIAPGAYGLATIFDKDILLYCISQLVEGMNRGRTPSKTVRVTAYDLLISTQRETGGTEYELLQESLKRLSGTRINTNIKTGGKRIRAGFGLIDSYRIIERSPDDQRMVSVEITLSDWLYNAIAAHEVLTIDEAYFSLRKPLERRLYELARKHCGKQSEWKISLEILHKKSGSTATLREFRRMMKTIVADNHLPTYTLAYLGDTDTVVFSYQVAMLRAESS